MELLRVELPKTHRLILAGDIHLGNRAMSEKRVQHLVERVASERNTYCLLMGDLLEAKLVDHKHWHKDIHEQHSTPLVQAEMVSEMLKPIRKKIIASHEGNHEQNLWRFGDLTRMICDKLGTRYGGFSAKSDIRCGHRKLYKLFSTHSRLRIKSNADDMVRKEAHIRLAVKRYLKGLAGDCAVMAAAHCHWPLVQGPVPFTYLTDDGEDIHAHKIKAQQHGEYIDHNLRWYCATGSFLRTQIVGATTYSERHGYEPMPLGWVEVVCDNGQLVGVETNGELG